MHRNTISIGMIVGCMLLALACGPAFVHSQVMSGSNYKVQFDSLNSGGNNSVSSSYKSEDTVGEVATGDSESASYKIRAGYQQMNQSFISITSPADATMTSINGVAGGTGTTSVAWMVLTDNAAGYSLSIKSSTNPALQATSGGAFFANYTPAGAPPDFVFTVANTTSEFGFSPEGSDIVSRYKDDGVACNTGSSDATDRCWDPFATTDTIIAQTNTSNQPTGATTTVKMWAESGTAHIQDSGTYQATLTVTAVTL